MSDDWWFGRGVGCVTSGGIPPKAGLIAGIFPDCWRIAEGVFPGRCWTGKPPGRCRGMCPWWLAVLSPAGCIPGRPLADPGTLVKRTFSPQLEQAPFVESQSLPQRGHNMMYPSLCASTARAIFMSIVVENMHYCQYEVPIYAIAPSSHR